MISLSFSVPIKNEIRYSFFRLILSQQASSGAADSLHWKD